MSCKCNGTGQIMPDGADPKSGSWDWAPCKCRLARNLARGIRRGTPNDDDGPYPTQFSYVWNDGYDQAIEELMSEVHERSPTMAIAIMNKFPTWKAIVYAARDQQTLVPCRKPLTCANCSGVGCASCR